jgi:hypothetical protein
MKPFVLKQHEKDFAKLRELRPEELDAVSGGIDNKVRSATTAWTPSRPRLWKHPFGGASTRATSEV